MAVVSTMSNHGKYQLASGNIDFDADVFKIILMGTTFAFDKDAHATLADTQYSSWAASTAYSLDDVRVPTTPNGHKYKCTTAGTSDATEPTWPTGSGATVMDGTVEWTEDGEDNQLPTGNGYTQNSETLANVSVTEDDTNDRANITWDNVTWTASGGDIGPTGAAIIYDDTSSDDTIIGCIDFGSDYTVSSGSSLQLQDLAVRLT